MKFVASIQLVVMLSLTGCAGGAMTSGNDGGSTPINANEELAYKRAINKCYKTGGSRVVKVEGQLLCY